MSSRLVPVLADRPIIFHRKHRKARACRRLAHLVRRNTFISCGMIVEYALHSRSRPVYRITASFCECIQKDKRAMQSDTHGTGGMKTKSRRKAPTDWCNWNGQGDSDSKIFHLPPTSRSTSPSPSPSSKRSLSLVYFFAGGGSSATNLSDTVSSSNWKWGFRKAMAR